jgi:hypothetical protein
MAYGIAFLADYADVLIGRRLDRPHAVHGLSFTSGYL